MSFIVAIDGPTSSGKSTLAKNIAKDLGFINIQTGAMYRCVTKLILDSNIKLDDMVGIEKILKELDMEFKDTKDGQRVFVNKKDVTTEIRTKEITDCCSKVASISLVREFLIDMQREMAKGKNVVIEGRDVGTNVFPDANLKIFLNANPKVRVQRKFKELQKNSINLNFNEVAESVYNWDRDAINRENGALKRAPDAIYIDSSSVTEKELTELVVEKIKERYIDEKER